MYRRLGGEGGASLGSSFKQGGWKWVVFVLTALLFLLFVIWCLVLLYVLIDQVRMCS
jgi:preprotein translocase subunit SecG